MILTVPSPNFPPNSFTIGLWEASSLYAIPKIPTDWSPPTSIVPLLSTLEPFTAYTPTACLLTTLFSFSTSIFDVASIFTKP